MADASNCISIAENAEPVCETVEFQHFQLATTFDGSRAPELSQVAHQVTVVCQNRDIFPSLMLQGDSQKNMILKVIAFLEANLCSLFEVQMDDLLHRSSSR